MPGGRCGCANDRCSCFVIAGPGIEVTGGGSQADPIQVSATASAAGGSSATDRLVGEVITYAGAAPPDSTWLLCNGQAVSRATYAALFTVCGTFYGAGDGSTTFNVPNLQNRAPVGSSGTHPRGEAFGTDTTALSVAQLPSHTHTMTHAHTAANAGSHDHSIQRSNTTGSGGSTFPKGGATDVSSRLGIAADGDHTHTVNAFTGSTSGTGSGTPVPTQPPSLALNFLIKAVAS